MVIFWGTWEGHGRRLTPTWWRRWLSRGRALRLASSLGKIWTVTLSTYCFPVELIIHLRYWLALLLWGSNCGAASHFSDSNRLHRRIKMQSLGIDQEESTPPAKLTRQCMRINTISPPLGKSADFFLSPPPSPHPHPHPLRLFCNMNKTPDLVSLFKWVSDYLKFIMEYQLWNRQKSLYGLAVLAAIV